MSYHDDLLDEETLAADRVEQRRATVVSLISFVLVVVASVLVLVGGIPSS